MAQHDALMRVRHMRDHAAEAVELLGEKSLDDLRADRVLQLALVQLIQIVGEAAARVDEQTRHNHPNIPWTLAAGMRNRLIHGYDVVEYAVVHDTVRGDLPKLVEQLDAMIASVDESRQSNAEEGKNP